MTEENVFCPHKDSITPWYCPKTTFSDSTQPRWSVQCQPLARCIVIVHGNGVRIDFACLVIRILFLALVWFSAWNVLPSEITSTGTVPFDTSCVVLVATLLGGLVHCFTGLPSLLCILLSGALFNNLFFLSSQKSRTVHQVTRVVQQFGLCIILLRAGLLLSWKSLWGTRGSVLLLGTLPLLAEAGTHALVAKYFCGYHTWFAFLQGFLCSPISPAIVLASVAHVRSRGVAPVLGSLLEKASSLDAALGISMIGFFVEIGTNKWSPQLVTLFVVAQTFGGILLGAFTALVGVGILQIKRQNKDASISAKNFFSIYVLLVSCSIVFFGSRKGLVGGASLAVLSMCASLVHVLETNENSFEYGTLRELRYYFIWIWEQITLPILFALVGAQIVFRDLFRWSFLRMAAPCLAVGLMTRIGVTFLLLFILPNVSLSERMCSAILWGGKATTQAAQAIVPLLYFENQVFCDDPLEQEALMVGKQRASDIYLVCMLAVIITSSLASLTYTTLLPRFLKKREHGSQDSNYVDE